MLAGATEKGICLLEFTDSNRHQTALTELETLLSEKFREGKNKHIRQLKKELNEYFRGKRKEFSVNLLTPGTPFSVSVWKELLKIPFGCTQSYMEQARALGKPGSARAVANANGKNRIAIVIPCHRVIGSDGELTGYGGGLKRKEWLLQHEKKYSGKPVDLSLF